VQNDEHPDGFEQREALNDGGNHCRLHPPKTGDFLSPDLFFPDRQQIAPEQVPVNRPALLVYRSGTGF